MDEPLSGASHRCVSHRVPRIGVHSVGVPLIGVYSMGVHSIARFSWGCLS
jgi:hypothetical protein